MSNIFLLHAIAITAISGLLFSTNTFANDANLNIRVSGAKAKNTCFLCVNGGCINLAKVVKGKSFPLTPGHLNQVFVLNANNLHLYKQALPQSCQVKINSNQTLNVTGKIQTNANGDPMINKLDCQLVS